MDIGKEADEPVEYPMPVVQPVRRNAEPAPEPATAPVEEPAHAMLVMAGKPAPPKPGPRPSDDSPGIGQPKPPRGK